MADRLEPNLLDQLLGGGQPVTPARPPDPQEEMIRQLIERVGAPGQVAEPVEPEPLGKGRLLGLILTDALSKFGASRAGRAAPPNVLEQLRARRAQRADRETALNQRTLDEETASDRRTAGIELQRALGQEGRAESQADTIAAEGRRLEHEKEMAKFRQGIDESMAKLEFKLRADLQGLKQSQETEKQTELELGIIDDIDRLVDGDPMSGVPALLDRLRLPTSDPNYLTPPQIRKMISRAVDVKRGGRLLTPHQRARIIELYNTEVEPLLTAYNKERITGEVSDVLGEFTPVKQTFREVSERAAGTGATAMGARGPGKF